MRRLGIGYAAVRRRLFDIGFILNRAAVFAGISAIVIGCFMLLEWLLGNWFQQVSHATNVLANVVLVLVLGFSMRFIHGWVEDFVDRIFFRKRHEDEEALKRFAGEAPYVIDAVQIARYQRGEVRRARRTRPDRRTSTN